MNSEATDIISELKAVSSDTEAAFGKLSAAQINWKPSQEGWSVGQCFEHLIKSNELFYNELDQISNGSRQSSFLEKYSPLSKLFGSILISSLKKDERKFKAPTENIVPPSEIDENIVELFAAHQAELIGKIKRTEIADWRKTKVTSPFLKIATYSLLDGYQVIVEHEKRHVRQAKRVLEARNFPKN